MNLRKLLFVALVCMLPMGCRQDPRLTGYLELLNAEKRALEDLVYDWEYEYKALEEELKEVQTENEKLRTQVSGELRGGPVDGEPPSAVDDETPDFPDLSVPMVEPGVQVDPSEVERTQPDESTAPEQDAPPSTPPPDGADSGASQQLDRVVRILLNQRHTRGQDFDGKPGDDGLSLVVEPINSAGAFVPQAGQLIVALLDPAKQGPSARVGKWTFGTEETRSQMRTEGDDRGIHLQMRWPDGPPDHSRLRMFVRFVAEDGRHVETEQEILVALSNQISHRWTPRHTRPPGSAYPPQVNVARQPAAATGGSGPGPVRQPPPPAQGQGGLPQWKPYR